MEQKKKVAVKDLEVKMEEGVLSIGALKISDPAQIAQISKLLKASTSNTKRNHTPLTKEEAILKFPDECQILEGKLAYLTNKGKANKVLEFFTMGEDPRLRVTVHIEGGKNPGNYLWTLEPKAVKAA